MLLMIKNQIFSSETIITITQTELSNPNVSSISKEDIENNRLESLKIQALIVETITKTFTIKEASINDIIIWGK